MIPAWVREYIGVPFKACGRDRGGLDCWGALYVIYREQFGIDLPSYADNYAARLDREEVARLIGSEMNPWRAVARGAERCGDAALFRIAGDECHVALVVAPPLFLHCQSGTDSCLERWDALRWRRRLVGIYRHEALA
jgi:cell wall-associated NlpC family hydrolase